jgi:aminoacylase
MPKAAPVPDLCPDDAVALADWRALMRIRSISGEVGASGPFTECAEWLRARLHEIGIPVQTLEPVAGKPILIATVKGTESELPCVLLNSHYDVVPVMEEHWNCDPFAAELQDGYDHASPYVEPNHHGAGPCVVGRGAQDMKCVVTQYVHALRRLRARPGGWTPRRTVHLTFVPDEEVGGVDGMSRLIASAEFAALHPIGLALDEGLANPRDHALTLFYGERAQWWLLIRATGPTGHGRAAGHVHTRHACEHPARVDAG